MSLLENIATYLHSQITTASYGAKGLTAGVNLYLGRIPAEAPNAVVLIQQYEGQAPTFTMGNQVSALEHPRIQILVRAEREDYPGGYEWARLVRDVLCSLPMPDATYFPYVTRIEPLGIPNPIGYDELERPRFTMNFEIHVNAGADGMPIS